MAIREFNVNEIASALAKKFNLEDVVVQEVFLGRRVGDLEKKEIGMGGVLTITCYVKEVN